jgi:hypothetical protein
MDRLEHIEKMLFDHSQKSDKFREEIKQQITEQNKSLARLEFVLLGDEKAGVDGIAQKVLKHDKYIQTDKKIKWVTGGASIAASGGMWAYIKGILGL